MRRGAKRCTAGVEPLHHKAATSTWTGAWARTWTGAWARTTTATQTWATTTTGSRSCRCWGIFTRPTTWATAQVWDHSRCYETWDRMRVAVSFVQQCELFFNVNFKTHTQCISWENLSFQGSDSVQMPVLLLVSSSQEWKARPIRWRWTGLPTVVDQSCNHVVCLFGVALLAARHLTVWKNTLSTRITTSRDFLGVAIFVVIVMVFPLVCICLDRCCHNMFLLILFP